MENQKWLEAQRLADYERAVGDKHSKVEITGSYIRLISRRSTYNTVTFSNTDCIPSVLLENNVSIVPPSKVRWNNVNNNLFYIEGLQFHVLFNILRSLILRFVFPDLCHNWINCQIQRSPHQSALCQFGSFQRNKKAVLLLQES